MWPSQGSLDALQLTLTEGETMKKLFMIAMAAAFSMAMVAPGYAQTTTTTPPATEKKEEKKAEKAEKKAEKKAAKAEKKAAKDEAKAEKKEEKKAANPCAAKAEKK
jgi:mannitol-specific phosphotransferase system IIBC component